MEPLNSQEVEPLVTGDTNEADASLLSNLLSHSRQETELSVNLPRGRQTVESFIQRIGFGRFQIKLSLMTGLAWMADAVEMMILSILSPVLHCDWQLTSVQQALITTVVFCGMMISSSIWGTVCDKWGRRTEIVLSCFFTFYYGLLSALSPNFIWMLFLRGMVGFGEGGAPQSMVLYAEFLPPKSRTRCMTMIGAFWGFGSAFEVLLALAIMPLFGWRYLLAASAAPLLVFLIFSFWLPESPTFNVTRGHPELAVKTLERIARDNRHVLPVAHLKDMDASEVFLNVASQTRGQVLDLLKPEQRRTTLLLWFIWFSTALSYYGLVLLTTEFLEHNYSCGSRSSQASVTDPACELECKMLTTRDYISLMWTSFAEFPGLVISVIMLEYIGRKPTMAIQLAGFSTFALLLNICVKRATLTFFLFSARVLVSSAFRTAYIYTPEVYPTAIRAIGVGSCSGAARAGAIFTSFIAQVLLQYSSYLTLSVYAGLCLAASIATILLPIETRGRQMAECNKEGSSSVLDCEVNQPT